MTDRDFDTDIILTPTPDAALVFLFKHGFKMKIEDGVYTAWTDQYAPLVPYMAFQLHEHSSANFITEYLVPGVISLMHCFKEHGIPR